MKSWVAQGSVHLHEEDLSELPLILRLCSVGVHSESLTVGTMGWYVLFKDGFPGDRRRLRR